MKHSSDQPPPLFAQPAVPKFEGIVKALKGEPDEELTIAERFAIFLREQPEVYPKFCELARAARAAGFKRYSARTIAERIRWHFQVEAGAEGFKLNDHYTPPMARLLERDDPSFVGFFEDRGGGKDAIGICGQPVDNPAAL